MVRLGVWGLMVRVYGMRIMVKVWGYDDGGGWGMGVRVGVRGYGG